MSFMQPLQLLRTNIVHWLNSSVNGKIFRAALTVGMLTLLVKGIGFVKSLVVAYQFGTADTLDAFYIAWILPSMAVSVLAVALNNALVPTYVQLHEQGDHEGAQTLLGNVLVCAIALFLVCSLVLVLAAPYVLPLLGRSFDQEKIALTQVLFFILLLTFCIRGVSTILAGVLNARYRFALAAITPTIVPITSMVALLCTGSTWDIYAFAWGMVAGFALEAVILAWQMKRFGVVVRPRWSGINGPIRQVMAQYGASVAAIFLITNASLVDQAMAAAIGSGSVAVLNYAGTITDTILMLGAFALGTAVLPYFSRMVAREDWKGVRSSLAFYTRLVFVGAFPIVFCLIFFSQSIISLIFERGAFSQEDVYLVAGVQTMFALQLPFYILAYMLTKLLASLKRRLVLIVGAGINLIVNIVMNYLFMALFGLQGIALSTSIVYIVSWIFLMTIIYREIRQRENTSRG